MPPLRRRTSDLLSLALVSCLIAAFAGAIFVVNDDVGFRKDFVCQFTDDIVDVNLGDGGTMFVTTRLAFWRGG